MTQTHNLQLQTLITRIGPDRKPYVETGRKFDRVFVNGKVTYFVARFTIDGRCIAGDIFGAKSKLAPNMRWYFGNLANVERWDWSGDQPVPAGDDTVMAVKRYADHVHYVRIPQRS